MPTSGKLAASTAEPQPPKVSQNVPIASATYFLVWSMVLGSCFWLLLKGRTTKSLHKSSASGRLSQVEPSANKKQERSYAGPPEARPQSGPQAELEPSRAGLR